MKRDLLTRDAHEAAKREIELGADATRKVGSWTRYLLNDEVDRGGQVAQAATMIDAPQWPSVVREVFSDLYGSPGDERLETPADPTSWVAGAVDTMTRVPEWIDLRARTAGDEWAAGLAVAKIAEKVSAELEHLLPKTDERAAEDKVRAIEDLLDELNAQVQAMGGYATPEQEKALGKLGGELHDAEHALAAARNAGAEAAKALAERGAQRVMRSVAAMAAEAATDEIDAMRAAMRGLGAGAGSMASLKVRAPSAALIDALKGNEKLRKVAAIAGRLRAEAARKQAAKVNYAREEIASITNGSEIARLVPSELTYLADDDLEAVLLRKLAEGAAVQYELRGNETSVRGPIVLAIDESGSMQGARDEWAKAVAITLADVAARQRRDFVLVHFDGMVRHVDRPNVRNGLGLKELIDLVCRFSGGGTNIRVALDKCVAIVAEAKDKAQAMKDADIVLITDGADYSVADYSVEDGRGRDTFAKMRELGVNLHGIAIESTLGPGLTAACATVARVGARDLNRDGAIDAVLSI